MAQESKRAKKQRDPRVEPHSVSAEQSVLGCAFIDQDACFGIMSQLREDDFYLDSHRTIFDAMYDLYSHNKPVEYVTLTDALEVSGRLDEVGGYDYISLCLRKRKRFPIKNRIDQMLAFVTQFE